MEGFAHDQPGKRITPRIKRRMSAATPSKPATGRHRPKSFTVFAAAFIAGAAAAVGVNRVLDVQLAQRRPQVECEPIFVALRSLPQGSPVTVWDVALKDWPKAMLPGSALRASDSFEGFVLRHAIREGQPLLAVQLVRNDATSGSPGTSIAAESFTAPVPATPAQQPPATTQADLWTPAETAAAATPKKTGAVARQPQMAVAAAPKAVVESPTVAAEPTPAEPTVGETDGDAGASSTAAVASVPAALPQATATMAASSPMPPSPTDIEPPTVRGRPTPVQGQPENDPVTEAVVTDVASMPSVMTRSSDTNQPAGKSSGGGDAGRYLVVPERIALQADTSFTTPRPQPPGPPSAPAPRPAQTQSQAQASQATSAARSPSSAAQQRQRQAAVAGGQVAGRRGQQPTPQQSQQQPGSRNRQTSAASPQRSWSGMFPNMAAGVEALGSAWQKPKADSGTAQPSTRR
jgi:hypothetical protein